MMPRGIRSVQIVLGGLCAALGLVVALEVILPIINDVTAAPADNRNAADEPAPLDLAPPEAMLDDSVNAILERPLFSTDRRAAPQQIAQDPQATAPTPPPLPDRLDGVVLGPNEREALFGSPGQKPIAVAVGGTIGGWTVSSIELDRVVLTSAFGEKVLEPTAGPHSDSRENVLTPHFPVAKPAATPTAQISPAPSVANPRPQPRLQEQRVLLPPAPSANRQASPHP
jgi:hypothetical protein